MALSIPIGYSVGPAHLLEATHAATASLAGWLSRVNLWRVAINTAARNLELA